MEQFSGALRITGLDDFISPGVECVKPSLSAAAPATEESPSVVAVSAKRSRKAAGESAVEKRSATNRKRSEPSSAASVASISLADCLACSGCITSAETVLVTAQSVDQFLEKLEATTASGTGGVSSSSSSSSANVSNNNSGSSAGGEDAGPERVVVSLSPQTRASIAAHYGVSLVSAHRKLNTLFCQRLGAHALYDVSFARLITLLESRAEFLQHYRKHRGAGKVAPLIASACPGWICYAEKTHGDYILPYISRVKSPQQVMGSLVKRWLPKRHNVDAARVYHAACMPCYDKKLEASRADFYNDVLGTRDVDTVLTSGEIVQLMERKGIEFAALEESAPSKRFQLSEVDEEGLEHLLGEHHGSGGYLIELFKYVAKVEHGVDVKEVEFKQVGRNPDYKSASLVVNGVEVLKMGIAYGFRNIQNVVRKIKQGRCTFDYIEVMACPSGCLNGGGQVRSEKSADRAAIKERLKRVTAAYQEVREHSVLDNAEVREVYEEFVGDGIGSERAQAEFYTQYHAVPKMQNSLMIKW